MKKVLFWIVGIPVIPIVFLLHIIELISDEIVLYMDIFYEWANKDDGDLK